MILSSMEYENIAASETGTGAALQVAIVYCATFRIPSIQVFQAKYGLL